MLRPFIDSSDDGGSDRAFLCSSGHLTYGQAMGGWGKLSVSSGALFLEELPLPFVSAETILCEGLFARGETYEREACHK